MTQDKPYLFLNRLVITALTGAVAYDEVFHEGLNIIRGKNSSGKSTISNFIFYALGGDYNNWNTESLKCREVFAEVKINGAVLTLRRIVSASTRQPMSLFWGSFEEAKTDSINWQTFPYQQTEERVSFSNMIFKALSFPEVKSENDSNITMHQILRLLYIDQDSPTQCIFRREIFDHPLTRQAVSELLLGVYDDSLYTDRLSLRSSQKSYDEKKREFDGLNKMYFKSGNATNLTEIVKEIEVTKTELENTQGEIARTRESFNVRIAKNSTSRLEKIQSELIPVKQQLRNVTSRVYEADLDIVDSRNFVEMLQKRVVELDSSMLTHKVLGELSLTHCPQCLTPLASHESNGQCVLCKQPLTDEEERTHAKRLKQELELQIKESKSLLIQKERVLSELRGKIPELKERLNVLQKELNSNAEAAQSSRNEKLDELLIKKGGLEKQIEILTQQLRGIDILEQLKKELAELSAQIERLKLSIQDKTAKQQLKQTQALNDIQRKTLSLLRNDLDRQGEFKTANIVEIDFYGDTMSLDGNFNFSASSNTYLKNAIRFSIFFSSLDVDFMRYPRFLLCDNMEDKGMEKERSQNFQNLITSLSDQYKPKISHQVIFTTSMIADELNGSAYCVGPEYDQNNKTLRTEQIKVKKIP